MAEEKIRKKEALIEFLSLHEISQDDMTFEQLQRYLDLALELGLEEIPTPGKPLPSSVEQHLMKIWRKTMK